MSIFGVSWFLTVGEEGYIKKLSMIITYKDLPRIRERHKDERIVFCSGSFDIFHAGHVLFLEEAKSLGDVLIVAVGNDTVMKLKGENRPINNEHVRVKVIDAIKGVDYAFVHDYPLPPGEYHNAYLEDIFPSLRPDKWIVNTDASEIPFRKELAKKYGIEFIVSTRMCPSEFGSVSTSQIIEKIKKSS